MKWYILLNYYSFLIASSSTWKELFQKNCITKGNSVLTCVSFPSDCQLCGYPDRCGAGFPSSAPGAGTAYRDESRAANTCGFSSPFHRCCESFLWVMLVIVWGCSRTLNLPGLNCCVNNTVPHWFISFAIQKDKDDLNSVKSWGLVGRHTKLAALVLLWHRTYPPSWTLEPEINVFLVTGTLQFR